MKLVIDSSTKPFYVALDSKFPFISISKAYKFEIRDNFSESISPEINKIILDLPSTILDRFKSFVSTYGIHKE
jgi:hypothetical protein